MNYEKIITEELARHGRSEVSPRWVEAWIRLELGVLDWLVRSRWRKEVRIALECIDSSTREDNEQLARSIMGHARGRSSS